MINTNASGIFKQHRLGGAEEAEQEDPSMAYEEQQQRVSGEDGTLNALRPINFNEKIMGGQKAAAFMDGKFAPLDGSFNYAQRVNALTGKGVNTMEEEFKTQQKINSMLGQDSPTDKVKMMTGGFGSSSSDKMSMLLGNGMSGEDKIAKFLGKTETKKGKKSKNKTEETDSGIDKINKILGNNKDNKKEKQFDFNFNFDTKTGFGNRAFAGMTQNKTFDMSKFFNTTTGNKNLKNAKNNAVNKINNAFGGLNNGFTNKIQNNFRTPSMHNLLGNPEKIAKRRMKQQKGLTMFGDFDGDRLLNAFDCDPLDPLKQGEQHDLTKYMPQENDANMGLVVRGETNPVITGDNGKAIYPNTLSGKPYHPETDLVTQSTRNAQVLDENGEPVYAEEPDSASADIRMGNSYTGYDDYKDFGNTSGMPGNDDVGNKTINITKTINNIFQSNGGVDVNNDGKIDEQDKNLFGSMTLDEQIAFAANKMAEGGDKSNKYKNIYQELLKTKRAEETHELQKQKYEDSRLDKKTQEELKQAAAIKQKDFLSDKFSKELSFEKKKFKAQQEEKEANKLFGLQQFEYQKERDAAKDEQQTRKEKRAYDLEKTKLKMQEGKNDRALWESKLRAGENMLGSLLGGSNKPADLGSKVGSTDNSRNIAVMSGAAGSQGGNPQNMMMMAGGMNQSPSFGNKVAESVGANQQGKGWAQKVSESVGRKSPDEIMKEERQSVEEFAPQQRPEVVSQTPQPQIQQQIRPQVRPQVQPQQRVVPQQYGQQPMYMPQQEPDWDEVSPQQAAQYDPEYARYLAESKGETTYRRGPYKKRRF